MTEPQGVVWVNGEVLPAGQASVSALDRGLLYGDGVFETIRVYGGVPFRLAAHLARLAEGLRVLQINLPGASEDLGRALVEALRASGLRDAYARLTVTRGVGGAPSELAGAGEPTVLVHVRPFVGYPADLYERGMGACVSAVRRNETSPLSRIKSLNYLDCLLVRASADAASRGCDEAVMLNTRGELAEGTASNLFVVRGGQVLTPPVAAGCLPGIARAVVMELAPVYEATLALTDLSAADEAFLTNSLMEVMPLVRVDEHPVGSGLPGPVARRLLAAYRATVAAECEL